MEKYLKVSTVSFINTLEYRLDFFFDLISKFFPAIIQFFMWTAIFSNSPDAVILNYTYNQMILYTVISIFVSNFISVNVHWGLAQDIKNGILSKYIILPLNYFWYKAFNFIGAKISDIVLISIGMSTVIFFFWKTGFFQIQVLQVVVFCFVAVLALILQFLICYSMAGIAFWLGECGGIFTVVNVISLIISGAIFPLDIFGETVVKVSQIFPFYYITYFPTNILIGKIPLEEVLPSVFVMLIWLVILSLCAVFIWKEGMKKYIAAGG